MVMFLAAVAAILAVSCVLARDRGTWVIEVFPAFIGVPILVLTFMRFLYALFVMHGVI
jgi:uncharacterized membrane protein YjdF